MGARAIDAHKPMTAQKKTPTATRNPYRLSAKETLENEGWEPSEDGILAYAQSAMFESTSPACCTEGCVVEPDGHCSHGCPSLLIALGMI